MDQFLKGVYIFLKRNEPKEEISKYPNERNKSFYSNLVMTGVNYFFEFSPIEKNQEKPYQIYRMFQWGKILIYSY